MKTNRKAKIFIILSLYLSLLFIPETKCETDIEFKSRHNIEYANYSNGKVYIAKGKYISKIYDENTSDVYIIDQRFLNNSNMEIVDSYKITSKKEMEEIINILLQYEKNHPSSWNRNYYSMLNEWEIHNLCYKFNIDEESTKHVDLDNEDETKYNGEILTRLFGYK